METNFGGVLAELRHESGMNQRQLASELHISQALLSHYENGSREPGLMFVCRVCDYFGVSADYILGRSRPQEDGEGSPPELKELSRALLETHNPAARRAAENYLYTAAKRITLRLKFRDSELQAAEQAAEMSRSELDLIRALSSNE